MFAVQSIRRARLKALPLAMLAGLFGIAHLGSAHANTLHVTDDAHVDMANGAANFGSYPKLIVQNVDEDDHKDKGRHEKKRRRNNDKATYVSFSMVTLPKLMRLLL